MLISLFDVGQDLKRDFLVTRDVGDRYLDQEVLTEAYQIRAGHGFVL